MSTLIRNMPYFRAIAIIGGEAIVWLLWAIFWVEQMKTKPDDAVLCGTATLLVTGSFLGWFLHGRHLIDEADERARERRFMQDMVNRDLNRIGRARGF